jgi:hypothetical protein
MRGDEVDGLPYPVHRPMAHSPGPGGGGAGPTCRTSSGLVVLIVGDVYCGKGSFPVCRYLMEDLSFSVPAHGILHIVNRFLPGDAYLLAGS